MMRCMITRWRRRSRRWKIFSRKLIPPEMDSECLSISTLIRAECRCKMAAAMARAVEAPVPAAADRMWIPPRVCRLVSARAAAADSRILIPPRACPFPARRELGHPELEHPAWAVVFPVEVRQGWVPVVCPGAA